jgi:hypothetical protein
MSSRERNKEKREERQGALYAECGETRNWPEPWSEAKLRGYDRRKRELADEPKLCAGCGKNWADLPSRFCPGCEAYREHTGQI